ncbi:uncharacterized protein B0I36DRAFT_316377 [Microdochium trichocladiopsis]|uniref:Uncharacterized protein n=1 Tax=Microdochium trichocladiopsis TaxID=1682393 RepID=A0A9P8YI73_9PEZI|nr:uncharacterized protein B0I36DRAFT_343389 [Microdochium trichocladiopsis]XP_046017530.1 uncharacterized protein B0I36DRAFT_316169 [Microdochium trichocladiopsis]XP_046017561.1 uncharacterized protein B0I36DRAFT_316259 [Microdochium trichocladiopsis]XP_046017594.1 uncharacterized protein B0I36DRAFT_316377 [Microdochium trichocladiopsis]KAH7007828.1 hypothetical protein B0I36DRAFT_343389 [Microdochium trichocladiopsis]KAH7038409.1 hypothetical protein B0I36DRAFT_316169 [Microdochium trichocla
MATTGTEGQQATGVARLVRLRPLLPLHMRRVVRPGTVRPSGSVLQSKIMAIFDKHRAELSTEWAAMGTEMSEALEAWCRDCCVAVTVEEIRAEEMAGDGSLTPVQVFHWGVQCSGPVNEELRSACWRRIRDATRSVDEYMMSLGSHCSASRNLGWCSCPKLKLFQWRGTAKDLGVFQLAYVLMQLTKLGSLYGGDCSMVSNTVERAFLVDQAAG